MNKTIYITGACFGLLAVILGAFGAHTLGKWVDAPAVATFDTGVRYQMYHSLFLLVLGSMRQLSESLKKPIFYLIVTGTAMFSGSIYMLATNSITAFDFKTIGFITPIGGGLLITGWALLIYRASRAFYDVDFNKNNTY